MTFMFPPQVSVNTNPNFDSWLKLSAVGFNNFSGRLSGDASGVLTDRHGFQTPIISPLSTPQVCHYGSIPSEFPLIGSLPTLERSGSLLVELSNHDNKKSRSGVLEVSDSQGVGNLTGLPARVDNYMNVDSAANNVVPPHLRQSYAAIAIVSGKENAKGFHGLSDEDTVV
ncbi:hypothetical protein V6N13_105065 [Hibiscus sabdariffa]|uniref:Uncharacterized protein n=1 Tax=Hibiscus sabdariffa TaxID=183260 RepID=A0ABR2SJV2_9ROSI